MSSKGHRRAMRNKPVTIPEEYKSNKGVVVDMREAGKSVEETTEEMNKFVDGVAASDTIGGATFVEATMTLDEYEAREQAEQEGDTIHIIRPIDKVMKNVNRKRLIKITAGVAIVSGGLFIINQMTKKDVSGIAGRVVKVAEKVDEVNE